MYLRVFWQSPSLSNLLVIDQAWTKKLKPTCSAILVFSFVLSSKFRKEYISNCHDKHSYKQTASRILNPLLCAWKFGKTRSFVFDAIVQLSPCFININYLWLGFFFKKFLKLLEIEWKRRPSFACLVDQLTYFMGRSRRISVKIQIDNASIKLYQVVWVKQKRVFQI